MKRKILIGSLSFLIAFLVVFLSLFIALQKSWNRYEQDVLPFQTSSSFIEVASQVLGKQVQIKSPSVAVFSTLTGFSSSETFLYLNDEIVAHAYNFTINNPSWDRFNGKFAVPEYAYFVVVLDKEENSIVGVRPFIPVKTDLNESLVKYFDGKDVESILKDRSLSSYTGEEKEFVDSVAKVCLLVVEKKKGFQYAYNLVPSYLFKFNVELGKNLSFKAKDGKVYSFKDFADEPFVIFIGSPSCGSCISEVIHIAQTAPSCKVLFFALSDVSTAISFPNNVVVVLDTDKKITTSLRIPSSPFAMLLEKNLKLVYSGAPSGFAFESIFYAFAQRAKE